MMQKQVRSAHGSGECLDLYVSSIIYHFLIIPLISCCILVPDDDSEAGLEFFLQDKLVPLGFK